MPKKGKLVQLLGKNQLQIVEQELLDFGRIVTNIFPLDQVKEAVDLAMDPQNKGIKIAFRGKAYE